MPILARMIIPAAAFVILLALAGCTTRTAQNPPSKGTYRIAVEDKSPGLELTPQLVADLRDSAAGYLREQGLLRDGEYVLKVNLTPEQSEATGQWVVLRITLLPARTYTLIAVYPGPDDYYPYDPYGFYHSSYPGFARYGYYNPFDLGYGYGGGYYQPTLYPPPGPKSGERPGHPPGTLTRWDRNRPGDQRPDRDRPRPDDGQTRPTTPRHERRNGAGDNDSPSPRHDRGNGGHTYTPRPSPPTPTYSPPPSSPPPEPQRAPSERDNGPGQDPTVAK